MFYSKHIIFQAVKVYTGVHIRMPIFLLIFALKMSLNTKNAEKVYTAVHFLGKNLRASG